MNSHKSSRQTKTSDSVEFTRKLKKELQAVPPIYREKNFVHIDHVAKALKGNPTKYLEELNEHYKNLSSSIKDIVEDILLNLKHSQDEIESLEKDTETCEELLSSRANDLETLYKTYLQNTEFINILNMVESVKAAPNKITKVVKEKHYLKAVEMIHENEDLLRKEELTEINALINIRTTFQLFQVELRKKLVKELKSYCYNGDFNLYDYLNKPSEEDIPDSTKNSSFSNLDSDYSIIEKNISSRIKRDTFRKKTLSPFQTEYENEKKNSLNVLDEDYVVIDDLSIDPEFDKAYFVRMIIESLEKLGELDKTQSELTDNLPNGMSTIINNHILAYKKIIQGKNELYRKQKHSSNDTSKNPLSEYYTALNQEKPLMKIVQTLLNKFYNILNNHRFVIEIMDKKNFADKQLSNHSSSENLTVSSVWKQVESQLITVLKEILGIQVTFTIEAKKTTNRMFDFEENLNHDAKQKSRDKSSGICSPIAEYFTFTPYNLIWMYRLVEKFIKNTNEALQQSADNRRSSYMDNMNLSEFLGTAVTTVLSKRVLDDYKHTVEKYLRESIEAFQSRESLNIKNNPLYDENFNVRPLLFSSIRVHQWINELSKFVSCIQSHQDIFFDVMNEILDTYISSCVEKLDRIKEGIMRGQKYIRNPLNDLNIKSALIEDPRWNKFELNTSEAEKKNESKENIELLKKKFSITQYKKFERKIEEHVDNLMYKEENYVRDPVSGVMLMRKDAIIDKSSEIVLICNLYDSLKWLSEKIKEISETNYRSVSHRHGRHLSVESNGSSNSYNYEGLQKSPENSKLQGQVSFMYQFSQRCLFILKAEIRVRCFYFLDNIKKSIYKCEEESMEPEGFVKNFNNDLSRLEKYFRIYLPKEEVEYIFEGICALICNILIRFVVNKSKTQKSHEVIFNEFGVKKMKRNIFSIQQNLINIMESSAECIYHFSRVNTFFNLLILKEEELTNKIKELKTFSSDEQVINDILPLSSPRIKKRLGSSLSAGNSQYENGQKEDTTLPHSHSSLNISENSADTNITHIPFQIESNLGYFTTNEINAILIIRTKCNTLGEAQLKQIENIIFNNKKL